MITFLIVCILIGIVAAFVAAPILMIADRKKLREMDALVDEFMCLPISEQDGKRMGYRKRLARIKESIWSGDKQALEAAKDRLAILG